MMGRPSTYDPAYCDQVVEFLKDGYSLTAFAGEIGVARSTIFKWAEEHSEFSDSIKMGQAAATLWWEKANRALAVGGSGNATACIFGLKNRAAEDWRDISTKELSGPNGAPIETTQRIERVIIDPANPDAA
jgi:hypothetical protein